MIDIVERLRNGRWIGGERDALEAADEIERLRSELQWQKRATEMSASLLRDKRRTQARGAVADMVERIAQQFDRCSARCEAALRLAPIQKDPVA